MVCGQTPCAVESRPFAMSQCTNSINACFSTPCVMNWNVTKCAYVPGSVSMVMKGVLHYIYHVELIQLLVYSFLLTVFLFSQFSLASRASDGGHRTSGKRALYMRVGLLHSPDGVHIEGHAHTRYCLSCFQP